MAAHFFTYQRRGLGVLLAWGAGNTAAGIPMLFSPDAFVRQFGLQTLIWGAIDAALALAGRHSAQQKATRYERGELDNYAGLREARQLRRILLMNAGLDVGYILGGTWIMHAFPDRRDRCGVGLGIVVQGVFLLIYDGLFAWDLNRRWLTHAHR
jgi:hypothetical protein